MLMGTHKKWGKGNFMLKNGHYKNCPRCLDCNKYLKKRWGIRCSSCGAKRRYAKKPTTG